MSILNDKSLRKGRRRQIAHFGPLMQILDHASNCKFYPNYYYVPQGGKIYDEETAWFSAATSGQKSVKEAMESLAKVIKRHCGGECKVVNEHLGAGYHPTPCPFTYDPSGWIRK